MINNKLRAIGDHVLAVEGDFDAQITDGGIYVQPTIGKSHGITARWFQVYSIGPKCPLDIVSGQWILVGWGRWSESVTFNETKYWRVDIKDCLCVSDEKPSTGGYLNPDTTITQ